MIAKLERIQRTTSQNKDQIQKTHTQSASDSKQLGLSLSSGFPTKRDSNQSPQLQRLARKARRESGYGTFQ